MNNNCFKVSIANFSGVFKSGSFHLTKRKHGIKAHGHAEVDFTDTDLEFGFTMSTQTTPNGKIIPKFSACDYDFDLDKKKLSFHIHGSFWSDIGNAFRFTFEGKIVDALKNGT